MSTLRTVVIKPVLVDAVNRIIDEDHDTHGIEFDPSWTKHQFYLSMVEASQVAHGRVLGLSKVGASEGMEVS